MSARPQMKKRKTLSMAVEQLKRVPEGGYLQLLKALTIEAEEALKFRWHVSSTQYHQDRVRKRYSEFLLMQLKYENTVTEDTTELTTAQLFPTDPNILYPQLRR